MASELEKLRKSLSADSKKRAKQTFQSQQRTISSTGSAGNTPIDKNKLGQNLERQKRKEERLENVRAFLEDWGDTGKGKKTTTNNIAGSIPGYTPMTDRQADVIRDRRKQFTKESGLATLRSGLADIETSLALSGGKDEFLKRKAEEYRRQLEPLERHVDQYSEQLKKQKWVDELEEQYNNNFRGRSLASINSGRIQLEKGRAANEFGAVPTEENEEYRQFMNAVEALYNQNNMDLLDEGKILSNSFASYLPQLGNQIVNTAPYTLVGGALGGVGTVITGNPQFIKKGVQIGSAIGSGITSYNDIRGAVINDLLNLGIDRETAIAAAHDEAVLSGVVEMAETAVDLSPKLGILGGAIDSATNVITKAGTKVIPNAVLRKVAVALGKYGINISSEALEEGLQEVISIANQNRITGDAETGYSISDTGVGNLLKATANQVFDLSAEEKAQVLGSAKEGAKIAAVMGGINTGIAHTTNRVTTTAEQIRLGRERNESGTVEEMIQEGLAKKEDSQAYKIAKKLQEKSEAGENITSREIGQLYKANEVAFKKAEELVDETEEQAKERKSMIQEILDSYGKVGKETLEKFRDANIDLYDFHKEFSKFYQGGLVNEDLDKLTKRYGEKLPSQVREAAHIAGTRDAELSLKEDVKNATPEVYANTKGGIEANEHATKVDKKTYAKVDGIAKLFGTQVRFLPKVYTYDSNGKVTGEANGNYNGKVLEVSLDAENPVMVVITHELTHHLKRIAPAEYRIFRDAAVRYSLMQGGDSTTVVEQYRRVYSGRGVNINQEGAMDEIAADTAMLYALDENKDILEEIATTPEERNAFQKIIDSIKEFLQKIKNYLKSDKSLKKTLEANEIEKQVSEMERIVDLWKDALRAAKSNLENAEKTTTAQPKESKPLNSLKSQKLLTKDALEVDIKKNTTDAHNLLEREIRKDGYKAIGHGDASTDSKPQQQQGVKQFSLKQDSNGRTLSEEQAEYFKDSKIRDENGNLKVMYHGTMNEFTVFDTSVEGGKNGTAEGFGLYFADTQEVTKAYGNRQLMGYVNITNPARSDKKTIKQTTLVKLVKALCEAEAKQMVADEEYDNVNDALKDTWVSNYVFTYDMSMSQAYKQVAQDIIRMCESDMEIVQEVMSGNAIRSYAQAYEFYETLKATTGIDGYITEWTGNSLPDGKAQIVIAFDSNQFKNIDNKKPTQNPDIRFSLKNTKVPTYEELVAKPDVEIVDISKAQTKGSFKERRKAILEQSKETIKTPYLNVDTGTMLFLTRSTYTHAFSNAGEIQLNATEHLPEFIKNAILTHVEPATHGNERADGVYTLFAAAGKDGDVLPVKLKVKEYNVTDQQLPQNIKEYFEKQPEKYASVYDSVVLEVLEIKENPFGFSKGESQKANYLTPNGFVTIKVSDLLGLVKGEARKYIPTDSGRTFSLKGQSNILKENARLKKYNDYLKNELKLTKDIKPDKKAMRKLTKDVLKEYKSTVPAAEIQPQLDELYNYLATPDADWNEAKNKALGIANDMLREATVVDTEVLQEFKDFKEYLKDYRISISEGAKGDFKGEWNQFRKRNFGWLTLTNDGENIDKVYQGLADMFPEYVDSEITNEADQLMEVERAYNLLKNVEYNPYSSDMEVAAEYLANDIIDRFFDIPRAKPTFADKKQTQIDRIRHDSRERVKAAVKKEREKNEKKLQTYKEQREESRKKMSDRRKRKIMREKILRHIKPMQKKLLSPTDKQHVPEELRTSVAAVLAQIDTSSNRLNRFGEETKRTEAFKRAKEQLLAIQGDTTLDPSLFGNTEEGIESNFDAVKDMADIKLADMTLEQLDTVWKVVVAMETAINNYNKALAQSKFATIVEYADAFDTASKTRKDKKGKFKKYGLDLETPYTFFSHFGDPGMDFYRMLRNAQDYEKTINNELAEKVSAVVSKEQRKQFEKKVHTFETENGDTINLTTAHIMELYVAVRREQFAGHLYRGGMVQPEINRKIRRGTDAVKITEADTTKMFKALTQEEKDIADAMQKITLFLADKGNEASMKAYGYKKFTDPNYWTIKSAKEGLTQTVEKGQNQARSIANMGSAKAVVPNASNPLELGGMFNTFDQHASDMITYSAWLLPMEDANRLFNFKFKDENGVLTGRTLQGIINRVAGEKADQYWLNLMRDIQNGIGNPSDDSMSGLINKAINNVKKASVATNIRVVVQQPIAYLRALAVLSPMDLEIATSAILSTKGAGWQKALKYAPIAARKAAGGFDVAMSPTQLSETLYTANTKKGKAVQLAKDLPTLATAKADEFTWGLIWNACEYNIGRTQKDLKKGSEEFYEAVAAKFTDVIDQTQVVDGVLQRSQIMRSSKDLNRQATSFMGEAIMSLNVLMRAMDDVRYQTGKARSEGFKKLGRSVMALLVSNVAVALAQSLVDAARDDETEEKWLKRVLAAFTGITGDEETWAEYAASIILDGNVYNSNNMLTWIPYVKDIHSMLQGYTVERMDAAALSDLLYAAENSIKSLSGEGKWTQGYAIGKVAVTGAKLLGSSAGNLLRDVESVLRSVLVETDNYARLYDLEKAIYDVKNNAKYFYNIAYKALKAGDTEAYNYIVADMIDNGIEPSKIQSSMKTKAKADPDFGENLDGFDATSVAAGIKFTTSEEEREEAEFDMDSLTGEQYTEYNEYIGENYQAVYNEMKDLGLYEFGENEQNDIIADAYNYVASQALREVAGNSYTETRSWVLNADEAVEMGISPARYFVIRKKFNTTDAKVNGDTVRGLKKQRMYEYLSNIPNLTTAEYNYFWKEVFGYK